MPRHWHDPSVLTREFLYQVYVVEKRPIITIAREVGCRNGTIVKLLRDYGFSKTVTKEWMIEQYVTLGRTVDDIAQQLECTEDNIRYYLRNFAIPIRYKKRSRIQVPLLHDYDWLYERYVIQGLSTCQIGDELNARANAVLIALRRLGIPIRHVGTPAPCGKKYYYHRNFSHRKRHLIYQRDGYMCQWPGCGSTTDLDVHHIDPSRNLGSTDLDNGITLCKPCHHKTLRREEEFAPLFHSLIALKKSGAARLVSTPTQMRLFF